MLAQFMTQGTPEPSSRLAKQRAASAARMRKSRANRAAGGAVIRYQLPPEGVSLLIELGWLEKGKQHNLDEVKAAFCDVLDTVVATAKITPSDVSALMRRRYAQQPKIG